MSDRKIGWAIIILCLVCVIVVPLSLFGYSYGGEIWSHMQRDRAGENPHGLPSEVGILGVAVSIDDFSADDIWFQTNEHGEYKKDLKHRIYAASLIRWGEGNYAIMNEGSIDVINPAHGSTKSIPTGVNAFGMMSGVQSENGTHLLLKTFSEESADRLFTLTDGERTRPVWVDWELEPEHFAVSDGGEAFILQRDEDRKGFCITSFTYTGTVQRNCERMDRDRYVDLTVFGFIQGTPYLFVDWLSDTGDGGWYVYKRDVDGWKRVNGQSVFSYDAKKQGYIVERFALNGRIYMLSEEAGLLSFPIPTADTVDLDARFTDLSDSINGPLISYTVDGNIIHYVFYKSDDVFSGPYLVSFNIDDPSKRVGPWEIPPELVRESLFSSYREIRSTIIYDQKTREKLGAA